MQRHNDHAAGQPLADLLRKESLAGRRALVLGLGRFGGGVGAVRFLAQRGARVVVADRADESALAPSLEALRDLLDAGAVELRLGPHDERDVDEAELVVASPAIPKPWDNPLLRRARLRGAVVTTEIALLLALLPCREKLVAVTGTAGKSTTSLLLAWALARAAGAQGPLRASTSGGVEPWPCSEASAEGARSRVFLGGNIGGSLLPIVERIAPEDWVVLELSSAQLRWISERSDLPAFPPRVAVVTNLAPNHLDWHSGFDDYARAKAVVARSQGAGDVLLVGPGVLQTPAFAKAIASRQGALVVVDELAPAGSIALPGEHNRRNAALALRAVEAALGRARGALGPSLLEDCPGLPHRLQRLPDVVLAGGGRLRVVNDSKATTPQAVALALEAVSAWGGVVHLLCGGYDKGVDLTPLARAAASRAVRVHAFGATGPAIARLVERAGGEAVVSSGLEEAVEGALAQAQAGQTLLLSPGCASWDQFRDYTERGARFAELVAAWAGHATQKSSEQT